MVVKFDSPENGGIVPVSRLYDKFLSHGWYDAILTTTDSNDLPVCTYTFSRLFRPCKELICPLKSLLPRLLPSSSQQDTAILINATNNDSPPPKNTQSPTYIPITEQDGEHVIPLHGEDEEHGSPLPHPPCLRHDDPPVDE